MSSHTQDKHFRPTSKVPWAKGWDLTRKYRRETKSYPACMNLKTVRSHGQSKSKGVVASKIDTCSKTENTNAGQNETLLWYIVQV